MPITTMTHHPLDFEELLENFDIAAYYAAKKLRADRPWIYDIIRVLYPRPKGLSNQQLYRELWALRHSSELPMPKKFEETIRSALNRHCAASSMCKKKHSDGLFYSPNGRGTWAVYQDRAISWLRLHDLPDL